VKNFCAAPLLILGSNYNCLYSSQAVSPVNCARRGWINVEMDVISCEACGARLLFSTPSSWTLQQGMLAILQDREILQDIEVESFILFIYLFI